MTPDIQFLINCCKISPTASEIKQIRTYITQLDNQQLSEMTTLAHAHAVFPLVYHAIQTHASDCLSKETLTELKQQNMTIVMQNMQMTAELIRIMRLLDENGIEALAFKGPTLAQIAYGDITLRQYGDLDILVNEKDAFRAGSLMSENGFEPIHSMKVLTNPICLEIDKDFSFISKSSQILVEMHWRLVPTGLNTHFDFEQITGNKQSISINGTSIPTLSSEHLLVYLCIHGSKHAWERIEWICDIDRLTRSHNIDWELVLEYTKYQSGRRPLLLGLMLSNKLLQTPMPSAIANMTSNEPDLQNLYLEVLSFFNYASISNDDLQRIYLVESFVAKVFHKKQNKILTFLKQIFKVSSRDCQYLMLPKKLKFLYIFIRPFRLIYSRLKL